MTPGFRAIPAGYGQSAAGLAAPATFVFQGDRERLQVATSALGLGIDLREDGIAVVAASLAEQRLFLAALEDEGSAHAAALRRYLGPVQAWRAGGRAIDVTRPVIMGILNLTADSFSGDGVGTNVAAALRHAEALREAGADIIDTGAESARADRPIADEAAEAAIVGDVIGALVRDGHVVSVDTYKPAVARRAIEAGASIVNDISGLTVGQGAAEEAMRSGAGYVLNYSFSPPKRRPDAPPRYADVVGETIAWMAERLAALEAIGLPREAVVVDPGIAFGKSHDEDLQMLRRVGELLSLGQPVLLAHSRKNFIGSVTGGAPADRDLETHVVSAMAAAQGVKIFRVHDVAGTRRALAMASAIAEAVAGKFAPDEGSWPWKAGAGATHMTVATPDKAAPPGQRW